MHTSAPRSITAGNRVNKQLNLDVGPVLITCCRGNWKAFIGGCTVVKLDWHSQHNLHGNLTMRSGLWLVSELFCDQYESRCTIHDLGSIKQDEISFVIITQSNPTKSVKWASLDLCSNCPDLSLGLSSTVWILSLTLCCNRVYWTSFVALMHAYIAHVGRLVVGWQVSELFSSFDDQPMEHQIELVDALEEFLNTWMIKHGLNGYVS